MDNKGLNLKTNRRQVVTDTTLGVYVWRVPDRNDPNHKQYLSDGEGHFLMINAVYGDENAKRKLAREVAAVGIDEGEPVFLPEHRVVSDEEFEEQRMRFELGLEPDPVGEFLRRNHG